MVARVKRYVASHAEGRAVMLPLQSHEQLFVVHAFLVLKPIACINDASDPLALLKLLHSWKMSKWLGKRLKLKKSYRYRT